MTRGTSAGTGMSQHTRMLTAMYDSRTDAEEAIERLIAIGIPRTNCRLVEGASTSQSSSTTAASSSSYDQGGESATPMS